MGASHSRKLNHEQNLDETDDIDVLSLTNPGFENHETHGQNDDDDPVTDLPDSGSDLFDPDKFLECLQEAKKVGDCEKIDELLSTLRDNVFSLMTYEQTHHIFQKFLDLCNDQQLNLLVQMLWRLRKFFVAATFCEEGVRSILLLMEKLKSTVHAYTITEILSARFFDLMTDYRAQYVILGCLEVFETTPNMILYKKAIIHFQELATHEVGCRSLNHFIDMIPCEHKTMLLGPIALYADNLSHDPYGSVVVEHILELKIDDVTCMIAQSLEGQFIDLAYKKGGSQIMEKCMEYSDIGMIVVVREILCSPKAVIQLAQNQFGNNVIQKALKNTKERGFNDLYSSLVQSLEPYAMVLEVEGMEGGKEVIDLMGYNTRLQKGSLIDELDDEEIRLINEVFGCEEM